jgi:hypothetical protein
MKTLGLFLLLLAFVLVPLGFGQDQSQVKSADDAIVALWNGHPVSTDSGRLEGDKLIISSDSDLITCLNLRVYRQKRESRKSDVTVPAGYTTCVPTNRVNVFKTGVYEPQK